MMNDIVIRQVTNGFIVLPKIEGGGYMTNDEIWAFESIENLYKWLKIHSKLEKKKNG